MRNLVLLFAFLMLIPSVCTAAEVPDFVRDVQPILTAHCAGCHNADEAYSGFRVDGFEHVVTPITSEDSLRKGPSLTAGIAETSRLYRLMAGLDQPRMPPEDDADAVPAAQLAVVKAWIDGGALGPDGVAADVPLIVPQIAAATTADPVTAVAHVGNASFQASFGQVRQVVDSGEGWVVDGLPGKVTDLVISPDQATLYVGSGTTGLRGNVTAIDVATGKILFELSGHRDAIYTLAISGDGRTLATGSYDREVIVWDLTTKQMTQTLTGHNGAIFDVAFDRDGKLIASASADETVKVWDVATGERLDTMPQPEGEVYTVLFSRDGRHVYAGSADNRVRKWKVNSRGKKAINPLQVARFAHEAAVTHLEFNPEGNRIVSASADKTIRVWSAGNLTQLATIGPVDDVVSTLDTDAGAGQIAVYLMNGQQLMFDLPTSSEPATVIAKAVSIVFPTVAADESKCTETEPNDDVTDAAMLALPARVEGVVSSTGDVDHFAFEAKWGEQWMIEVVAARGSVKKEARSPLDSFIEVLDANGDRIERVVLQSVRDSYFTFRGKNSTQTNDYRVFNWKEMELGDYFYANGEVSEFFMYPAGPDSGFTVYPGSGNRHLRFDTTGVVHALGDPAYVVKAYPPGSKIAPNGLPIFPVYFENDDDSLRMHGSDSVVSFTAPADGRYVVRVGDARGEGSDKHSYSLLVRPRRPDFSAKVSTKLDKVQPGSSKEASIKVMRLDGYEGPVNISVENLPAGFTVPQALSVESRQFDLRFPVFVADDAKTPTDEELKNIRFVATARTDDGRDVSHNFNGLGKLAVAEKQAPFSLEVIAPLVDGIPTIDLHPGETASLLVKANRGSFKGRIQFGKQDAGRNLPFGVFVDNIGLNGLMIPEGATEQDFVVTASPVAEPQERLWYIKCGEGGGMTSNLLRVRIFREQEVAAR